MDTEIQSLAPSLPEQATESSSEVRPEPILRLTSLLPWFLVMGFLAIPVVYFLNAYDPGDWRDYSTEWMNPATLAIVIVTSLALFFLPLYWVLKRRVIDMLALALAQQALILCGYFYLDQTAAHFPNDAAGILSVSGLVVLFNATGFLFFFGTMGTVYALAELLRGRQPPLPAPPALLDARLIRLARIMGVFTACVIAAPMILGHNIPLFSSESAESRIELNTESDAGRALSNAGSALLPIVAATLALSILRRPRRLFGWDGLIISLVVLLQFLTASRMAIAIALASTMCAVTMEMKFPRWLLAGIFVGYLLVFTFLSGFTSLLRTDPQALEKGTWLADSIQEAYLGDNIIDLRDGSWVFSKWDYEPMVGKTYLGGLVSMVPSGLFPEKKQWHLGLNAVRIVGMPEDLHFGLRVTFFGEAFLNFGWAGVVVLGIVMGSLYGVLLRETHLATQSSPCLYRNIQLIILLQCFLPLSSTSDAFIMWTEFGLLFLMWLTVVYAVRCRTEPPASG